MPGNGEQFKHAFRHFLAQLFKAWMRSGLMKLGDDVGDCVADAGNFCERACRDNAIQAAAKERQGCQPPLGKPLRGRDCRRGEMFFARIP